MSNDEYAEKVDAYAAAITDAVRIGVGHAIRVIEDYAADRPMSKPFCDDLADILRRTTAGITPPGTNR
jgi:hypothetical protein